MDNMAIAQSLGPDMTAALATEAAYNTALNAWAVRTRSEPERSWRGPGLYVFSGYMSDEWSPVATLKQVM